MKTFKIGDEIYFLKNNEIQLKTISGISTYEGTIKELYFNKEIKEGDVL